MPTCDDKILKQYDVLFKDSTSNKMSTEYSKAPEELKYIIESASQLNETIVALTQSLQKTHPVSHFSLRYRDAIISAVATLGLAVSHSKSQQRLVDFIIAEKWSEVKDMGVLMCETDSDRRFLEGVVATVERELNGCITQLEKLEKDKSKKKLKSYQAFLKLSQGTIASTIMAVSTSSLLPSFLEFGWEESQRVQSEMLLYEMEAEK